MSTKQRTQDATQDAPAADADLQRVREILFGDQARSTQQQLQEVEQRLGAQIQSLRQELELARQADGGRAEKALQQGIAQATAAWQQERDAMRSELQRQIQALRDGKLDRDAMAELLAGIANRIGKPGPG